MTVSRVLDHPLLVATSTRARVTHARQRTTVPA